MESNIQKLNEKFEVAARQSNKLSFIYFIYSLTICSVIFGIGFFLNKQYIIGVIVFLINTWYFSIILNFSKTKNEKTLEKSYYVIFIIMVFFCYPAFIVGSYFYFKIKDAYKVNYFLGNCSYLIQSSRMLPNKNWC